MSSFLDRINRGPVVAAPRLVVYGPPGVGKSSFAAGAPRPLFIDVDRRIGHLDVDSIVPGSWQEVLGLLRELCAAPGEYRTLVIDTLDHLQGLIHADVCARNKWANIEELPYQKGYGVALEEWRKLVLAVDTLRGKGVQTVMLAHAQPRTVQNPVGENYDVVGLKLAGSRQFSAINYLSEKVDLIGYAHFEDVTKKMAKTDIKAKALTSGERVLTFAHHPAFDTKQGIPVGDEIPLTWAAFEAALKAAGGK